MATKKPRTTTRRKPATRRKKKNSGGSKLLLITVALLLTGLISVGLYLFRPAPTAHPGVGKVLIESVITAAGVDLNTQRVVRIKDGIERWKVDLDSTRDKDAILKGLAKAVKAQGGKWDPGERSRNLHLIKLTLNTGEKLHLIFVTPKSVKKPAAEKPKPKPKTEPVAGRPPPAVPVEHPTEESLELVETRVEMGPAELAVEPADEGQAKIAIILDDIGHKKVSILDPVLELKFPVTFAVLPYLTYTVSNASWFHQNQYEVMLHMPMEPSGFPAANPGEGAIYSHLNDQEIRDAVNKALANVPFVSGVNNHMGSRITANRTLMRPVLAELKKRDLYFVDSRTQGNTIAYELAAGMGLRSGKRHVFLDSERDYDFIVGQLRETERVADKYGEAIAIGHPYPNTLKALHAEMPKMDRQGYRFVFASELVKASNKF